MAEAIFKDSFPDLKELENKVGRKTPESLLIWMRDAANREDVWRSDVVDRGDQSSTLTDSMSAKISHLKQDMRWLRRADVKILCQLLTVHEGIEDMRWMMENHGALTSRGSSLAGSLSSLVTVEEAGAWMSPSRESPSPASPQELTETTGEESEQQQQQPHTDDYDLDHKSYLNVPSPKDSEARLVYPSSAKIGVSWHTHAQASTNPASLQNSQSQDLASPLQSIKTNANTIRRALLRSSRLRKEVTADTSSFIFTEQSCETLREHQNQKSLRASHNDAAEEDNSPQSAEEVLLDYDAQWCWVESQDDVTFL